MPQDPSIKQGNDMKSKWVEMFDEYGVQFLIVDRHNDRDLLDFFRSQAGWNVDFEDEEALIFVHADID
jgi:hypothetical protein